MSGGLAEVEIIDEASGQRRQITVACGKSLLASALAEAIAIEHTCGGVGACSTCHVRVLEGASLLSEAKDAELDQLEEAPGYSPESRLACQAVIREAGVIRYVIPKWNRNAVKE